jgi:magnesium-protoporphyrin IX monomethyl ester (oxidative) cyclase
VQTNRTTARIFPSTVDVEHPDFFKRLDALVVTNTKLAALNKETGPLAALKKIPVIISFALQLIAILLMKSVDSGAIDYLDESELAY